MISGKTAMVWKIRNWMGGNLQAQVAHALELGLTDVCLKIVDGTYERWESNSYYPTNQNADYLPQLVPALRAAGLTVSGWGYTYGRLKSSPYTALGASEGAKAAQVCKKYGITNFLVDAEGEYERSGLEMGVEAGAYMDNLMLGAPNVNAYLCSYRFPVYHTTFPWTRFLAKSKCHAPQVYFLQALSVDAGALQLVESNKELQALRQLPFIGIAPTYEHTSNTGIKWRATKAQLLAFFQKAKDMGMPGVGIWALDLASAEQMAALRDFQWQTVTPPPVGPLPAPSLKVYLDSLDAWARTEGYAGVKPPLNI